MLTPDKKVAIYMEDALGVPEGKMGHGILKYSPNPVVAVIDSKHAGKDISQFVKCDRDCPIVASIEDAKKHGAEVLVLGIAPSGGKLPDEWLPILDEAVRHGFSIVNGLHDKLAHRYPNLSSTQWIWDIRQEPKSLPIATGAAGKLNNTRVLFIGSDMAVGKMTAGLELFKAARNANINTQFVATGQIGITITGQGVPLDAIRLDYACGAVENAVMAAKDADLVIIEGQGSLAHPGSTATLPLLRGSMPTHLVFCHRANQTTLEKQKNILLPPLDKLIKLYEDLATTCDTFHKPTTVGICLNTSHMNEEDAESAMKKLSSETNMPVWDVVRQSADELLETLQLIRQSCS